MSETREIQVLRTVALSYAIFLRPGQLFRTAWLLLVVVDFGVSSILLLAGHTWRLLQNNVATAAAPLDGIVLATAIVISPLEEAIFTTFYYVLFVGVGIIIFAVAAVPWQRAVVLGPGQISRRFPRDFGGIEFSYGFRMLALAFVALLAGDAVMAAVEDGNPFNAPAWFYRVVRLLVDLVILYPVMRMSMSLPAAVKGDKASFSRSVALTRGNGWRLVAVAALTILPIQLFYVPSAASILRAIGTLQPYHLIPVLFQFNTFVFTVAGITALSLCYRQLSADDGGQPES